MSKQPILMTFLMLFLSQIVFAQEPASGPNPKYAQQRFLRLFEDRKSLTADIVIEEFDAALDESTSSEGKLSYLKDDAGKINIHIGFNSPGGVLIVNDDKYLIERKGFSHSGNGDLTSNPAGQLLWALGSDDSKTAEDFDLKVPPKNHTSDVVSANLKILPKRLENIDYIEVWYDSTGNPIQLKVTKANKDTTTIYFNNVKENPKIDQRIFELESPKK